MSKVKKDDGEFIPCTREIAIGDDVVYRPLRSWHTGSLAGEGFRRSPGGDGSGCVDDAGMTRPPKSVTHRLYWNTQKPEDTISAFLSYPNGMTILDEYAWEALGTSPDGDIERWTGPNAETEMEDAIRSVLGTSARSTRAAEEAQLAREERPARVAAARASIHEMAEKLRAGMTMEEILTAADDDGDPFSLN